MAETKLPIRPAPEPPNILKLEHKNVFGMKVTEDNRDEFLRFFKLSRSQSAGKLGCSKKPPPRPPPPVKLITGSTSLSSHKQPDGFPPHLSVENKSGSNIVKSQTCLGLKKQVATSAMLIDLNSPPSSPTFTAHSSSDGFSIRSFGSDGFLTGINNSSQIESGFEDDFDLLMASRATTPSILDPWTDDPFSNHIQPPQTSVPFDLSNEDYRYKHKISNNKSLSTSNKPTIIRPKTIKPARPPPPKLRPSSTPPMFQNFLPGATSGDWSPPMPSCPPPPPPPEVLEVLNHGPSLPPRPSTLIQEKTEKKKPYCIALYDYQAGHPDDLSFKVNDVIHITERVNNDWLRGRLMGNEGMFPASYTNIVVPLMVFADENTNKFKYVVALFTFTPETWDDLPFKEGDTVKVTKRINDQWLYGECNGKQGQFPENYVSDVLSFFPLQADYC